MSFGSDESQAAPEFHEGTNILEIPTQTVAGVHGENPLLHCEVDIPPNWEVSGRKVAIISWGIWQTSQRQGSPLAAELEKSLFDAGVATVTMDPLGLSDPELGGKSRGGNTSNYSMPQLVHDTVELYRSLKFHPSMTGAKTYLVGISLGADTAIHTAQELLGRHEVLQGVVAVVPPASVRGLWNTYYTEDRPDGKVTRLSGEDENRGFIERGFLYKYIDSGGNSIPVSMAIHLTTEMWGMDGITEELRYLHAPLLCVASNTDRLAPYGAIKGSLLKRTDSTVSVVVEDVNHYLQRRDNTNVWQPVFERVNEFIKNPQRDAAIKIK